MIKRVLDHIDTHREQALDDLKQALRIPSVSTEPERAADVRRMAEWLRGHFEGFGLKAAIHETEGHPLVLAEWNGAPGKPTLLIYGHHDVQPAGDRSAWESDPFEPAVKDGSVFARGANDNKGQLFTHVKAAEAWMKTAGELPINVKFLIEGEEEIGSRHLGAWITSHPELIAADAVAISDTCMFGPGVPSLCTGLRGIATYEVRVRTGTGNVHSGSFGGAVPNANHVLASIIAALHDERGRVNVPGFYDDVLEPSPEESESWKRLPRTDEEFQRTAGAFALWGEEGRSNEERIWARPTLEIVGVTGGYQGPGHMGVVPCEAVARMSTRLVPNQDPAKIVPAVSERIRSLAPEGVEVTVEHGTGIGAVRIPTDSPWVRAATDALRTGFEAEPVFIREGGSIPIVKMFVEDLGLPCLLLGFGLPDDRIHGPNEKFSLENLHAGTRTGAALLHGLSQLKP